MSRLYFTLSIIMLASLMAGCSPSSAIRPQEIKVVGIAAVVDIPGNLVSAESVQFEIVPHTPPATCPITVPQDPPFTAPEPYSSNGPFAEWFWYGSNSLWTAIPTDAVWHGLPQDSQGYTEKIFWWNESYIWNEEPQPDLIVTGERLDAEAPPLSVSRATNAYADDIGSAMLVGVNFPTLGCWKITGQYKESSLDFVVWIAP